MKKLLVLLICAALLAAATVAGAERRTDVIYAPIDEETHEKISETWDYPVLKDGTLGSGRRIGEETSTEPHRFEDGRCIMCEYEAGSGWYAYKDLKDVSSGITSAGGKMISTDVKPNAASGEAVEAEEAPSRAAASSGFTGSLSAAQNRIAVRTLKAVFDAVGPGDSVKLVDADQVLDADQAEALFRLAAREQLMVLLAAMGYDIDETLSDDAQALLDAIRQRVTPEALLDAFPAGTVAIDGQEVDCFVMTLAVTSAGSEALEHYAFRKDNGAFAQLTIEG